MENIEIKELEQNLAKAVDEAVQEKGITTDNLNNAKLPNVEVEKGLSNVETRNKTFKTFISNVLKEKAYNLESSQGAYLVPVDFYAEVSKLLKDYGLFRQYATNIKLNSQTMTMPRLTGQASGAFVNEANAKGVSNNTFDAVTFTRHDYAFISPVSKQLLQDSGVDLVGLLAELAANDFARAEDYYGFMGTGSPIDGLTHVSGVAEVVLGDTLAAGLTRAKLIEMITAVPSVSARNAAFYMHRSVWSSILGLVDSDFPQIMTVENINPANPTLFGYPVRLSDVMNDTTVTSVGTPYVIFGDLKYAYLAERNGMAIDVATQATIGSDSLFEKNLVAFRFEESYDIKVVQPSAFAKLVSKKS